MHGTDADDPDDPLPVPAEDIEADADPLAVLDEDTLAQEPHASIFAPSPTAPTSPIKVQGIGFDKRSDVDAKMHRTLAQRVTPQPQPPAPGMRLAVGGVAHDLFPSLWLRNQVGLAPLSRMGPPSRVRGGPGRWTSAVVVGHRLLLATYYCT